MQALLEDIRQLNQRGYTAEALELVDLWLDEHPGDDEARLLKAEICLEARQNYIYVGQTLSHPAADYLAPFEALRLRSAELAWSLVDQGRERLHSRYPDEALEHFNNAVALLPMDAVIPLAAGLALLRGGSPEALIPTSPFETERRRLNPLTLAAQIEKYLRLVIDKTSADKRPYEVAAAALVRQWMAQNKLTLEGLTLLTNIPRPMPSTERLAADFNEQVAALTLETIANLLRIGLTDQADALIKTCLKAKLVSARLHLYQAERFANLPEKALPAYKKALRLAKPRLISVETAWTLLVAAQAIEVECPHCGKMISSNRSICPFCDSSLVLRKLISDDYPEAPEAVLAHVGMVEALVKQGDTAQALDHVRMAISLLPSEHRALKLLQALQERFSGDQAREDSPAFNVLKRFTETGISAELLAQIRRVNENTPRAWFDLPSLKRTTLMRALIAADQLEIAQDTLAAAFADAPGGKAASRVQTLLGEAVGRRLDAAACEVEGLIAAGQPEEAITLASRMLDLRADARLSLARGQARLQLGSDLAALDDFYTAANSDHDGVERDLARKAAALVLERHWDIHAARAMIQLIDPNDPDVIRLHARLNRRERGQPVILTEQVSAGVMEDTLLRREEAPYVHGYFALAVREVGFAGAGGEAWLHKLLNANFEFVQVLGALRDVMGDAVFVLRTISHPHRQIPERGRVTVALLVRVSAPQEVPCRARALQLWTDIHTILPLAQENVYVFEPVVDEDELRSLLTPFEFAHAAEIMRREFVDEEVYTVNPFAPNTVDLHNLHWTLLRQPAPAMVSIHLKPTHLLPWERSSGDVEDDEDDALDGYPLLDSVASGADPMNYLQLWEKLQRKNVQLNRLHSAYLLRVYVAGSVGTSQLLPEMAAAALFAPEHEDSGGYEIVRPQAFEVIRRNLSALDVESWTPDARFRYLVGQNEAAQVFRLPIPNVEGVPGMALLEGKPVVPPAGMPENGIRMGVSVARIKGVPLPITQAQEDRRRHLYVVGKTGMGKSTLLMTLILQDIEAGRGVFLLDPHGDLYEDVLARIPERRADDVILLDPSDAERPIGLNILDAETEADQHRVINEFIGLLTRLYDPHNQAIVGPIFQQNVRNAMLAAMSLPDGTLIDVYRLLADGHYIRRVLPHIQDPLVRNYWSEIAARVEGGASDHWKAELLPYLLSKFSRFVEDSTLRRMIGQPRNSIHWGRAMDESKIVLVNLAKGRIGQENSQFIGSLVLSSVLQAAFQRGELPSARRKEFSIYIDEVQNYATPLLATMLSEGRKFGVILTIANQFLHQLDNGIREAVFGNVGSLVAFRVGTQDAPALAPEFYPVFSPGDLLNLPQFTACAKLLIDGVAARPFSLRTFPAMSASDSQRAARIRELSRQRYGTDIASVQREIMKKF